MLSLVLGTLVGLMGVGVLVYAVNGKAARRLYQAIRAQIGKGGRAALEADPVAYLQQKLDDSVEKLDKAKKGLIETRGLVRTKTREVENLAKKQEELNNRLDLAITQNNDLAARDILVKKNSVDSQLERSRVLLEDVTRHYEIHREAVSRVSDEIAVFRSQARELKQDLVMSERERETRETLNSLRLDQEGPLDSSEASEAIELIQRKIDQNRGALDVDEDLAPSQEADILSIKGPDALDAQLAALKAQRGLGSTKVLSITNQEVS